MAKGPKPAAPIALSMGDPAGAGPHCSCLAWHLRAARALPPFVYIGAPEALLAADRSIPIKTVATLAEGARAFSGALPVLALPVGAAVVPGVPDPAHAAAIIRSLGIAATAALKGEARALVTNPVYKKSLLDAGFRHAGHTGYLGELTKARPVMMLANAALKAVPVTGHIALKDVSKILTKQLIIETAMIVARELRERFAIARPRLAMTGLNPHAGEEGKLGREETAVVLPALAALRAAGIDVHGPLPADTAFTEANRMRFDAFLAMTHDQALIPVKTLDFRGTVNITLGLPLVRTSPAHGTAFDLLKAGGTPDPESLIQALLMAARLSS